MTALFEPTEGQKKAWTDTQKAMSLPIGATSPLWLMFAGAASVGVAYWWLNRWRGTTNLEAVLTPALAAPEPALVLPEVVPPAVVEAFEAAAEVVPETVVEAVAEVAPEPVVDVIAEPVVEAVPEPVAEAPMLVSPVIEAQPEPVVEPASEPQPVLEVAPTPKPAPKPKTKAAAARAAPRTTSGPTRRS